MRRSPGQSQPRMEMKRTYLVAIDTETGGLQPGYHALLQLAAVPSWEAEPFNVWIWPDNHEIDPASLPVTGYSPEEWTKKKAVSLPTALELFRAWLEKAPVEPWRLCPLAHNAGFDRAFIDAAYRFCGRRSPLGHRWRCSQATFAFLQDAEVLPHSSTSLDTLAGLCGMARAGDEHDALDDARLCMAAYHWMLRMPKSLADVAAEDASEKATTPSLN
jgi:DNA polymerase III epsilon subunit-like protein